MQGVSSKHPPGLAAFCTGDLSRYTSANRSMGGVQAPPGSCDWWHQSNNIADTINRAFAATLENPELQWCWLMGDDHTFPADTILRLLDRDVDVVVPLCVNRYPPFGATIVQSGRLKPWEELPGSGLYRLREDETCGDAGLLVRRRVLEAMSPPWYGRLRSGALGVDDQVFVDRLRSEGFDVHVDLDTRIGHMTPFTMLPVSTGDGLWQVRLICGGKHVADIVPNPDAAA